MKPKVSAHVMLLAGIKAFFFHDTKVEQLHFLITKTITTILKLFGVFKQED